MHESIRITAAAFLWLSLIPAFASNGEPARVRVATAQGIVEGETLGRIAVFRGIPYALPPSGARRFKPAEPPASWAGIRPAIDMSAACPQSVDGDITENNSAVISEDCLALNVWTPRVDAKKRPVLFWIHGGAYVVGSSRNTWYDGAHLAARGDVVVVTINYRLGAWGFLSLSWFGPEYRDSANVGLLDEIAALGWVRKNIGRFGGDPDRVTIFGESAGASSVGALLAMPASEGLFSRAILESGIPSARTVEGFDKQNRLAKQFLEIAGVRSPSELESKSMAELLHFQQTLFTTHGDLGTFVPSIDGHSIPEQPFAVVAEGRGHRVPIMIGTTAEEMRYFSTVEDLGLERKPRALLLEQLSAIVGERAQAVLNTYQTLYPKWGDTVVQVASDLIMRLPSIRMAESAGAHQPVFMYLFTYRSNSIYQNYGSAHAMELPFVFGTVDAPEAIAFTGRDPIRHELSEKMMDAWVAFARTGNPTAANAPAWPAYDAIARQTMEFGPRSEVVSDPLGEQRKIWGGIMPPTEKAWKVMLVN